MIITDTQKLQLVLGGAITTDELPVIVSYADMLNDASTLAPNITTLDTTGTTPVDIMTAPAAGSKRQLKYMSIFNEDTVDTEVTLLLDTSGTDRIVWTITLQPLYRIEYTAEGFKVYNDMGAFVGIGPTGAAGTDGNTILYGVVAPTTEGVDGDFYIDTVTNMIYGPKAAGVWPAGESLVGPTGATGDPGPDIVTLAAIFSRGM